MCILYIIKCIKCTFVLVKSMKKSLSEMNNKYVDSFIEKEKRLLELKRQIKEHDSPNALKVETFFSLIASIIG